MATETMGKLLHDVVKWEVDREYCRVLEPVLDGQTIVLGQAVKLNSASKVVALDAAAVNEVQTVIFGVAATGGTFKIGVTIPAGLTGAGGVVWTDTIAWNTTDATFLAAMNTALDDVLGASKIVCTARSGIDTDLGFVATFSGTGYAGLPHALLQLDTAGLTSVTTATVTRTTAGHAVGADAEMVALAAAAPSGADGTVVCLVRGPAKVDSAQLTVPTGGLTNVTAALLTKGILTVTEPTLDIVG